MKQLVESWRKYISEPRLLIEGRIQDTQAKYPELAKKREELGGDNLLDVLISADPSNNQKYLMGAARLVQSTIDKYIKSGKEPFWEKKWPEETDEGFDAERIDNLISPWGITKNVAERLGKYHALQDYISDQDGQYKDINNIKDFMTLMDVIERAERKKNIKDQEKIRKKEKAEIAKQTSRVLLKTDDLTLIRVESEDASCYYGQGAPWCISATDSPNYFEQYTTEGKVFSFLFLKNVSNDNRYKKIAIELEPPGEFARAWDNNNDILSQEEEVEALVQNILKQKNSEGALLWYLYLDGDRFVSKEDVAEQDEMEYYEIVKELGIDYEIGDGREEVRDFSTEKLRAMAKSQFASIIDAAEADAAQNPGIAKDPYLELMNSYQDEMTYVKTDMSFPDEEPGLEWIELRASFRVDLPQILKDLSAARNMNLEWNIPPDLRRFAIESLESMVTDAFREQNIGVDPEELGGETLIFGGELDVSHAYDINAATEWFNQMLDVDRKIRTRIARSIGLSLLQSALIKDVGQQKQEQEPEELQEVYKRWRRLIL
jgi:hypothetical protein